MLHRMICLFNRSSLQSNHNNRANSTNRHPFSCLPCVVVVLCLVMLGMLAIGADGALAQQKPPAMISDGKTRLDKRSDLIDQCYKNCDKKISLEDVPEMMLEICHLCGAYWGNIVGFEYCCMCDPHVFQLCNNALNQIPVYEK